MLLSHLLLQLSTQVGLELGPPGYKQADITCCFQGHLPFAGTFYLQVQPVLGIRMLSKQGEAWAS